MKRQTLNKARHPFGFELANWHSNVDAKNMNPFDSPRSEVDPNLAADNKGIIYFSCPTWSNDILNIWLKED
jgi:hypothetical protein